MINSKLAPKITKAIVRATLFCEHGHAMHTDQQGAQVIAVCLTNTCVLYKIQYHVSYPVATLTKMPVQTLEGVSSDAE